MTVVAHLGAISPSALRGVIEREREREGERGQETKRESERERERERAPTGQFHPSDVYSAPAGENHFSVPSLADLQGLMGDQGLPCEWIELILQHRYELSQC